MPSNGSGIARVTGRVTQPGVSGASSIFGYS